MQDKESWLRLALIPGIGDGALRRLIEAFGAPDAALAASRPQISRHLSAKQADALQAGPEPTLMQDTQAWLALPGHHLITWLDDDYPAQLREMADPPMLTGNRRPGSYVSA